MATKEEILKNLGYSEELIAQLNLNEDFVYHHQPIECELVCVETQDFAELIIENVNSDTTSNF